MYFRKIRRKVSYFLSVCLFMGMILTNYASAATLSYYADLDLTLGRMVMYQTKSYYSYMNIGNNTTLNNQLISEIANAASYWKSGLGITLSANSSNTSSSNGFVVWCGSSSALVAAGAPLSSNQAGYTAIDGRYESVDMAPSTQGTVTVCKFTSTVPVYVTTSGTTANTIAHEMGHALGWYGHSSSSSLLMYKYSSSETKPQTNDLSHLKTVYSTYR
jgi:hypothetical protein